MGILSELSVSGGSSLFVLCQSFVCLAFPPVNGVQGGRNDFIDWCVWICECYNGRSRWFGLFSCNELHVVFRS